ncbi:MAG TPA: TRAP transporter small permease [Desulfatiglandales bacterium]|nr:TRAP transporter small permease [Desulfatiglandales bacterium]
MKKSARAHALRKAIITLSRWVYTVCGAGCLLLMIVLITADVVARYLFNHPIMSSYELVMFLMGIAVFTTLSYTATEKGHVRIELLASRLSERMRKILDIIMSILSAGLFALISQQTIIRAKALQAEGLTSSILHIPVYPFYLFAAFGFALLCLVVLVNMGASLMPTDEELAEE